MKTASVDQLPLHFITFPSMYHDREGQGRSIPYVKFREGALVLETPFLLLSSINQVRLHMQHLFHNLVELFVNKNHIKNYNHIVNAPHPPFLTLGTIPCMGRSDNKVKKILQVGVLEISPLQHDSCNEFSASSTDFPPFFHMSKYMQ